MFRSEESVRMAGLVLVVMLVVLVAAACSSDPAPQRPAGSPGPGGDAPGAGAALPAQQPGIIGSITELSRADGANNVGGRVLVEENPQESSGSDKALVTISARAQIFKQQGAELQPATFADLAVGQQVKVWYDGPVAESYPVQASAGFLVIDE